MNRGGIKVNWMGGEGKFWFSLSQKGEQSTKPLLLEQRATSLAVHGLVPR